MVKVNTIPEVALDKKNQFTFNGRAEALDALWLSQDERAADVLVEALKDKDPKIRILAVQNLAQLIVDTSHSAFGELQHILFIVSQSDKNHKVRSEASKAFKKVEGSRGIYKKVKPDYLYDYSFPYLKPVKDSELDAYIDLCILLCARNGLRELSDEERVSLKLNRDYVNKVVFVVDTPQSNELRKKFLSLPDVKKIVLVASGFNIAE